MLSRWSWPHPIIMTTGKWKLLSCVRLFVTPWATVYGILQARILEWVAFPFSRGIFPTQGSNPRLPHCKQILHCQNHRGSPMTNRVASNPSIPPPPPTHTHPTPHHIKLQRLAHGWTIFPSQSDQSLEILLNAEEVDTYHWNCWMCHWVRPRETSGQFCYHLRKKFPSY